VIRASSPVYSRYGDFPRTHSFARANEQAGLPKQHPRAAAFVSYVSINLRLCHAISGQHSGGIDHLPGASSTPFVPFGKMRRCPAASLLNADKDDCEDLGIIKVDLLGLAMHVRAAGRLYRIRHINVALRPISHRFPR